MPNYLYCSINKTHMLYYFHSSNNKEADKRASETITNRIHNEFNDLFSSIRCFEGTFSLQVKWGQPPISGTTKKKSLCTAKATERRAGTATEAESYCSIRYWLNRSKPMEVSLCFNPVQLNKVLIRPIHMDPALNDILQKANRSQILHGDTCQLWIQ